MARIAIPFVLAIVVGLPVLAAERMTDKDVKALVARIDDGRNRFESALDDKVKRNILRGPSGEVNVDQFLNDFEESVKRLEERLTSKYAASAEVGTLLRQASAIDAYIGRQPVGTKGASEWGRLAGDFKALAAAYGAAFPLAENAAVRRLGDGEVAAAAEGVTKGAERVKSSLDAELKKDPSVDKPTREATVREADDFSKEAKALRDRVKDARPSSAEAEALLAKASKLEAFVSSHKVPAAAGEWAAVKKHLETLAAAYGLTGSPSR
jgi:hypothetical protein